jgi:hypothetical protein
MKEMKKLIKILLIISILTSCTQIKLEAYEKAWCIQWADPANFNEIWIAEGREGYTGDLFQKGPKWTYFDASFEAVEEALDIKYISKEFLRRRLISSEEDANAIEFCKAWYELTNGPNFIDNV